VLAAAMLFAAPAGAQETALDRYVAAPDPNYRYEVLSTTPADAYTSYVLEMTSQQWRTAAEVDRPVWKHWQSIVIPHGVTSDTALLIISGGSNDRKPPSDVNPLLALLAVATHSVVSELRMVPNEPLHFAGETRSRSEDAVIAYSWDQYLKTGDDTWPLRLPMTKSAVRAMDTVSAFCRTASGGGVTVDKFVVGGGSKRGWTAWTTAAVDKRVVAVVPVVIDLLNLEPSFEHHYRAYGFWAPSLGEYAAQGIMRAAGTPRMRELLKIEDPYSYRARLTMPKYIVNSAGDQYFLPDSSQFYVGGLQGATYLRYVPNTDHSLRGSDAPESGLAFYEAILQHAALPKFAWRFEADGAIRVTTETRPSEVRLWQAANEGARDFRLATIGPAYRSSVLAAEGDGAYVGKVPPPEHGWIAYFVEMTYPGGGDYPFKFTTGVRVTPDTLPFAPPPEMAGEGRPPESEGP
jgi:PhoPQ-activated pathogenicity-related protein